MEQSAQLTNLEGVTSRLLHVHADPERPVSASALCATYLLSAERAADCVQPRHVSPVGDETGSCRKAARLTLTQL